LETGIHNTSEIGRLKKVLLHRPGQELENLMPEYLERLLFDDIPYLREAQSLCRRLELGLIFVGFSSGGTPQIDVAVHPKEASAPRRDKGRRLAVLREHSGRTGSANTGGVTRRKILTAYKEQSLRAADILRQRGPLRAGEVRELGGGEGIAGILGRNVLGWFGREPDPGGRKYLYHVTEKGLAALEEYRELL